MNGFHGPTETIRFCPESTAIKALIAGENLLAVPFTVTNTVSDIHSRRLGVQLNGYSEDEGENYPTLVSITFPGFYENVVSRILRREPRAVVAITISDTPLP